MTGHADWKRFRDKALENPAVRAGYDRADRMIRFGEAVREAREAAGMSQADLASRMGTGQPTIARLERGGVDPKLSTIDRINRALGTELVIRFVRQGDADAGAGSLGTMMSGGAVALGTAAVHADIPMIADEQLVMATEATDHHPPPGATSRDADVRW
jgi:DNA-binding XRE family transcriptional regulator